MGRFLFVSFGLLVVFLSLSGTGADCNSYWSTYEGRSYRFFKTPKNWDDAERFCSEEVNGGHLVSIESDGEAAFVAQLVAENKDSIKWNVWIGLRVGNKEKQCSSEWSDGSSISYENWTEAELKTCIALEEDSGFRKWLNLNCRNSSPFVCEV
uniref:BATXCTL31 n=1 Tax=Bothrops atrox TaxID=8725 RepID=A0A1L8D6B9_BOTAT